MSEELKFRTDREEYPYAVTIPLRFLYVEGLPNTGRIGDVNAWIDHNKIKASPLIKAAEEAHVRDKELVLDYEFYFADKAQAALFKMFWGHDE